MNIYNYEEMNMRNHEGYCDPTAYNALKNINRNNRVSQWNKIIKRVSGYRPLQWNARRQAYEDKC